MSSQLDVDDWRLLAVCRGSNVNVFFPEAGQGDKVKQARAICATCPVTSECLELGMQEGNEEHGIYGGKTGRERRNLRAERNRLARAQGR